MLRHLVETDGFPQERIVALSYGSARPLASATGTTDADLALNRRVDVVVLSNQEDAIRKLIPQVLGSTTTASG